MNKVILIGNVGKDPEVKTLEGGNMVASFPLATSESYKNKQGEKVDKSEWHNIVIWGNLAKVVESYVQKGTKLALEGKIQTRTWDDKEGNKRYATDIVCNNMTMLGGKPSNDSAPATASAPEDNSDELPF